MSTPSAPDPLPVPDGLGGWRYVASSDPAYANLANLWLQVHVGRANFAADISAWSTMTDAQKLSHVLGLMQAVVGIFDYLTGGQA